VKVEPRGNTIAHFFENLCVILGVTWLTAITHRSPICFEDESLPLKQNARSLGLKPKKDFFCVPRSGVFRATCGS
jgi:hypothetical protein